MASPHPDSSAKSLRTTRRAFSPAIAAPVEIAALRSPFAPVGWTLSSTSRTWSDGPARIATCGSVAAKTMDVVPVTSSRALATALANRVVPPSVVVIEPLASMTSTVSSTVVSSDTIMYGVASDVASNTSATI